MKTWKNLSATSAVAILSLAAADLSASAQSLTNGRNGSAPNTLSSKTMSGRQPSRTMMKPGSSMHRKTMMHRKTSFRYGYHPMHYAAARPLVVRPAEPVVAAAPVATGPGMLVTGPLGFGSNIAALPFRGLGTIFPATGDIATNPLLIIGAPLHVVADLVQVPFRVIGAPFGGTTTATY